MWFSERGDRSAALSFPIKLAFEDTLSRDSLISFHLSQGCKEEVEPDYYEVRLKLL